MKKTFWIWMLVLVWVILSWITKDRVIPLVGLSMASISTTIALATDAILEEIRKGRG